MQKASVISVPAVPDLLDLVADFFQRWEDVVIRPADGEVDGRCVVLVSAYSPLLRRTIKAYLVAVRD